MSLDSTTEPITLDNPLPTETMGSESSNTPPEAPETPTAVPTPEVVNNTAPQNTENKAETTENGLNTKNILENPVSTSQPTETKVESPKAPENPEKPMSEPVVSVSPKSGTGQIPVNDPLPAQPDPLKTETKISLARELLIKARNTIQFRKRKKLDKIMTLFSKNSKITNDEVEKFLHVSDKTVERYLDILEKENKIKQTGKTGHAVFYIKI